jgi:phenylpropionate dioxygenase-like ring-hydroxylating dioxygenase large terminal subunit
MAFVADTSTPDPGALVDPTNGVLSRTIYTDEAVYRRELDTIFRRAPQFLGHESQLREPGDYLTTFMGEDAVIVARGEDGEVRAFLNSCRHRGMRVCRADAGNAGFFRCPYHSWTYRNTGELVGVPKYRQAYAGRMDKADWGLLEVPRVESIHGFIFGSWDAESPAIGDYLGDFKTIFDLLYDRWPGGVEFVAGSHRWVIETNWKFPVENFACDMYHVESAHGRSIDIGLLKSVGDEGYQLSAGRGMVGSSSMRPVETDDELDEAISDIVTMPSQYTWELKDVRKRVAAEKGPDLARLIPLGHGTLFPNFSFLDLEILRLARIAIPKGPNKTEIVQWCVVDKALPEEVKEDLRRTYTVSFGPSGILEQDDGENWRECQAGVTGAVAQELENNLYLGLGDERPAEEVIGKGFGGVCGGIYSDNNLRYFYRHWQALMQGADWSDVLAINP